MKFWLDLGVDGFRVDAVPYLIEREGTSCENLPETHAVLKRACGAGRRASRTGCCWPRPTCGRRTCARISATATSSTCRSTSRSCRGCSWRWLEDRKPLIDIIERTPSIPDSCQWALFLRNHDELTLEMVTDVERDYMWEYAQDPRAAHQPRHPPAARAADGRRSPRIELMSGLLMSLPGRPIIYYGDEIGMGDNVYLGDRNGVRTPMQWNGGCNAGFSTADPERLWLPPIIRMRCTATRRSTSSRSSGSRPACSTGCVASPRYVSHIRQWAAVT